MPKQIFLVSTGRTGTKFFSKLFGDYVCNAASFHTTKGTELINIVSNLYQLGNLSKSMTGIIFKFLKYKDINSHTDKVYIECNPYYYGIMDIIDEFFDDYKVLFVVRSPKGYVNSHINKEFCALRSKFANRFIPYWQPLSYGMHLRGLFPNIKQRIDFYSKVWAFKNKVILNFLEKKGEVSFYRFEDIFSDSGLAVVDSMIKNLGLEKTREISPIIFDKKINNSENSKIAWKEEYDEIILSNCEALMNKFGY